MTVQLVHEVAYSGRVKQIESGLAPVEGLVVVDLIVERA